MSPPPVVGLDLGGTKIDAALVGGGGVILARHTLATPATAGAEAVLDALAEAVEAVRAPGCAAVGVAAAGVIDPGSGVVLSSTDAIRGLAGTALASGLAGRTGLAVACDNDVRAAAGTELGEGLGEGASGDERGAHDAPLIYAAIGTGVGGAVAVAGRVLIGVASAAGHLGHLPSPEAEGLPCTCGGAGHLEAIASGPAITAHYARTTGSPTERLQVVAARAARGDAHAAAAIALGARAAGRVLGGLANGLAPYRVVVAGGVPRIGAAYWAPLRDAFEAELIPSLKGLTPQPPRVGHDAAVLGAAALTRTQPLHQPHPTGATR
ncbi:ROK family protein [Streptomyces sp. A7024]|uniref:ROK family protein n=1 Tax=Streptomyces coryli TaxID=1128680 RepID=A0A6G4U6S6_9ACTN|nr:ROK family protein [Streptomyces coryli]NGN67945.1 ROK family protein [Streptomyces coryli]